MRLMIQILIIISSISFANSLVAQAISENITESEAYRLGMMVAAIQNALDSKDEQALKVITTYGTDSRYYSMIRGWLFQELVSAESLLHASKSKLLTVKHQTDSDFLKQAIRNIDLE